MHNFRKNQKNSANFSAIYKLSREMSRETNRQPHNYQSYSTQFLNSPDFPQPQPFQFSQLSFPFQFPQFPQPQPQPQPQSPEPYPQKLKKMIDHIGRILSLMLDNLKFLYETNGINYEVDQYYGVMMRLLTPHELLSHFHLVDNNWMFRKGTQGKRWRCEGMRAWGNWGTGNERNERGCQIYEEKRKNIQLEFKQRPGQKSKIKEPPSTNSKADPQPPNSYSLQKNTKIHPNPNHRPPFHNPSQPYSIQTILPKKLQQKLADWVIQQLLSKKVVKLKDLAQKSKQIGRNIPRFKSSLGWVTRFLQRHPYVRDMMRALRKRKYEEVRAIYNRYLNQIGRVKMNVQEGDSVDHQIHLVREGYSFQEEENQEGNEKKEGYQEKERKSQDEEEIQRSSQDNYREMSVQKDYDSDSLPYHQFLPIPPKPKTPQKTHQPPSSQPPSPKPLTPTLPNKPQKFTHTSQKSADQI